jgi:hypothetical protein
MTVGQGALSRRAMLSLGTAVLASGLGIHVVAEETKLIDEGWSVDGLAGTHTHAKGRAHSPAVLIIAGSGPTDRDGNQPNFTTNTYRLLAAGLAAEGISSLRYDKRGIGQSRALLTREEDAVFDHFVADAAAMGRALRKQHAAGVVLFGQRWRDRVEGGGAHSRRRRHSGSDPGPLVCGGAARTALDLADAGGFASRGLPDTRCARAPRTGE